MRWLFFFILLYLATALQLSTVGTLLENDLLVLRPEFICLLAVFYSLYSHDDVAPLSAFWCGLAYDLADPHSPVGLHAVALGIVGFVIVKIRLSIFREQPVSQMVMTILAVLFFGLTAAVFRTTAVLLVQGFSAAVLDWRQVEIRMLARLSGSALYTGVLAIPFFWLCMRLRHTLGFDAHRSRGR